MPFCTSCGQANPEGSRFCSNCGTALRSGADSTSTLSLHGLDPDNDGTDRGPLSAADRAVVDALPSGSAMLVVRHGPNSGSRFLLDSDVTTAGRHPESDIFLDDITVSRRHAEFLRDGTGYTVRDVGSLNGTYLNRERIESARLSGGDEVQIGKYRLVFFGGGGSAGQPSAPAGTTRRLTPRSTAFS